MKNTMAMTLFGKLHNLVTRDLKRLRLPGTALFALSAASLFAQNPGVIITEDGADPHPTSILDVKSSTQGLLIPRMTTLEKHAIVNPANSLMVYDLDLKAFSYYRTDNSQWQSIGGGSGADNACMCRPKKVYGF